jgi:hypothetical protein
LDFRFLFDAPFLEPIDAFFDADLIDRWRVGQVGQGAGQDVSCDHQGILTTDEHG